METDTERLDFMVKHCLCAAPNDLGEWQVFEYVPTFYRDGIVTGNSFHASARDAIDYAIECYLGGESQYGDPSESVLREMGDGLDVIGSFPMLNLPRNDNEPDRAYRNRLIERMRAIRRAAERGLERGATA